MKKPIKYETILKELRKGNAVMLEVAYGGRNKPNRYRIVTPESCEYFMAEGRSTTISTSCFMGGFFSRVNGPRRLVRNMKMYDYWSDLQVVKMVVL